MLSADAKVLQRIGQHMQRVLIVDPHPAATKLLSELLRDIGPCQVWTAVDPARALVLAQRIEPHIVFVEHGAGFDGAGLTRELRRSDLGCRKAPVIMISAEATASAIIGARDAGVHEFLRRPYTIKDLLRRLEAVFLRPRDWVEGVGYIGPDRRRFNSGDYSGPLKRRVDHAETPNEARIAQALKILKAAVPALEYDPRQALRAMQAQADELMVAASSPILRRGAMSLREMLASADHRRLDRSELEALIGPLLKHLTDGGQSQTAAA